LGKSGHKGGKPTGKKRVISFIALKTGGVPDRQGKDIKGVE